MINIRTSVLAYLTFILISCGTDFDKGPSGEDCFDLDYMQNTGIKTRYMETNRIKMDHYRPTGFSGMLAKPVFLYLIQENEQIGGEQWSEKVNWLSIKNFEYEWGYTYELAVEQRKIIYPVRVMDAPGVCHILVKVMGKEIVDPDTRFEVKLIWRIEEGDIFNIVEGDIETGFSINGSIYDSIYDSIAIECSELCEELRAKLELGQNLTGVFQHTFSDAIILTELKSK